MGLKNRNTQRQFLKIKDGKIFVGKDTENGFDEFEGTITGIRYKDEEFNGNAIRKFVLTLEDETDTYELGINTNTSSYGQLVSFLANVDLGKKLTLHPKFETVKGKDGAEDRPRNSILVSQDGKFAKSFFNKDNPLPEWKKVKVGKQVVIDKEDYLDAIEKYVNENFHSLASLTQRPNVIVEDETPAQSTATGRSPWDEED